MAYQERMRVMALEDWRYRTLIWATQTAFSSKRGRPPEIPAILRKDPRHAS
jgi:hypothetical protein